MRELVLATLLLLTSPVLGQTYLGVLTSPSNTGPGGSCCSSTSILDASNQSVPNDGSCGGCSVITSAQYNAYQTATATLGNAHLTVSQLMTTGITITGCTTNTAFNNFTFAVTTEGQGYGINYLSSLISHYVANLATYPNATAVPNMKDTAGGTHPFATSNALKAIGNILFGYHEALNTYVAKVSAGQSPALPPTTSSSYGSC